MKKILGRLNAFFINISIHVIAVRGLGIVGAGAVLFTATAIASTTAISQLVGEKDKNFNYMSIVHVYCLLSIVYVSVYFYVDVQA